MAGRKLFTNRSDYALAVTLLIRSSDNPNNQAGIKQFTLAPSESQWQEYGNDTDIYLNGFKLVASHNGALIAQQDIVVIRASPLDNQLNMFNAVDFVGENWGYSIRTQQA
ncbi:hypothetical protein F2P45_29670 [Massilia sp. CCM 8733]|uniref:Uncharacterized protein n=1 Tax=Massilia mucilaginosa TaxID=2609282 RepID=A0ABX0P284_9BURK|nr:hypothetical protein [Massilia mucilaginosa]NHZ93148.1 hypothetical protein [Massilia mucilaginosa]